jgi:hypothetical protein
MALMMPVAGILTSKCDPRAVIAVGFAIASFGLFHVNNIYYGGSSHTMEVYRLFLVIGIPLIFINILAFMSSLSVTGLVVLSSISLLFTTRKRSMAEARVSAAVDCQNASLRASNTHLNQLTIERQIEMKTILAAAVLLAASSAFAASPNITGKWTIHQSIAGNESDMTCTFVQTDAKLTGSCKGDKEIPITGGVDGDKVTWKYDTDHDGTSLTLTYTATMSHSDTFSGNVDVQPFSITGDFTATPLKDPSK